MLRPATARVTLRASARPSRPRLYSSQPGGPGFAAPAQPKKRSRTTWIVGGAVVTFFAWRYYSTDAIARLPSSDPPIQSPVKTLDFKAADKKLRRGAKTFVFDSADGAQGSVHALRIASNRPVEDVWTAQQGKGLGGNETLYFGVYDGHA